MGVSFTFLPIAREVVMSEINAGTPGKEAYGKFLGTCILTSDEKTPNRLGGVGKNVFVESFGLGGFWMGLYISTIMI